MKKILMAGVTLLGMMAGEALAQDKFVTIGTGGQTGVYYQVGGAICRLVNRTTNDHGIKCTHTTGGSVDNINGIHNKDLDMGVAQSDWQYHAYMGTAKEQFPDGPYEEIRSVFSVHPEPFTVVARADSGINSFEDLKGKRVNIGNPGSGQNGTMKIVMEALDWTEDDFALVSMLKASEQSQALCDNKVDAIIYVVGHPNGSIKEATTSCASKLISVDGDGIQKLIDDNSYYANVTIPAGMYSGTDADVNTFGVGATFIASTETDDETIYQMVKAVFDNFDRFKRLHPAFANLEEEKMISNNLTAPLHPGAIRYYKERGWIEE